MVREHRTIFTDHKTKKHSCPDDYYAKLRDPKCSIKGKEHGHEDHARPRAR